MSWTRTKWTTIYALGFFCVLPWAVPAHPESAEKTKVADRMVVCGEEALEKLFEFDIEPYEFYGAEAHKQLSITRSAMVVAICPLEADGNPETKEVFIVVKLIRNPGQDDLFNQMSHAEMRGAFHYCLAFLPAKAAMIYLNEMLPFNASFAPVANKTDFHGLPGDEVKSGLMIRDLDGDGIDEVGLFSETMAQGFFRHFHLFRKVSKPAQYEEVLEATIYFDGFAESPLHGGVMLDGQGMKIMCLSVGEENFTKHRLFSVVLKRGKLKPTVTAL